MPCESIRFQLRDVHGVVFLGLLQQRVHQFLAVEFLVSRFLSLLVLDQNDRGRSFGAGRRPQILLGGHKEIGNVLFFQQNRKEAVDVQRVNITRQYAQTSFTLAESLDDLLDAPADALGGGRLFDELVGLFGRFLAGQGMGDDVDSLDAFFVRLSRWHGGGVCRLTVALLGLFGALGAFHFRVRHDWSVCVVAGMLDGIYTL